MTLSTAAEACRPLSTDAKTCKDRQTHTHHRRKRNGKRTVCSCHSQRLQQRKVSFVALNCAAIPANLLESELFGYEEGAFTGAKKGGKIGLFQTANMGTLFLDEIGEMTLETQAKLLRVLEEQEIMRVGSDKIIKVDTRIIAATNKNLKKLVEEGAFRLDLYYRLNTLMVNIPPLRERPEDIKTLARFFISQETERPIRICDDLMNFLMNFSWEGNVRELRNCIEYMVHVGVKSSNRRICLSIYTPHTQTPSRHQKIENIPY